MAKRKSNKKLVKKSTKKPTPSIFLLGEEPKMYWNGTTLYCDRVPLRTWLKTAESQIAILEAFEKAGWVENVRINPEPGFEIGHKERLRNTVRNLNDALGRTCIVFHTDDDSGVSRKYARVS